MPAQSSQQRAISKQILELKGAIQRNELDEFERSITRAPSEALLAAIREQKLIFQLLPKDLDRVFEALSLAAGRVLSPAGLEKFKTYLQFSRICHEERCELLIDLDRLVAAMPRLTICDLANLSRTAISSIGSSISGAVGANTGESVAVYEHRLHAINGRLNDYAFAVLRAVNEIAKTTISPVGAGANWKNRQTAEKLFRRIMLVAGKLNTLDYAIDGVSYGKFNVKSFSASNLKNVTLELADERLERIRSAGIRRGILLKMSALRTERYVRNKLLALRTPSTVAAISQILEDVSDATPPVDISPVIKAAGALLSAIDAEDDLLYAAAKDKSLEVASFYYAAIALRWYAEAILFVEGLQKPAIRKKVSRAPISFPAIANGLREDKTRGFAATALKIMTSDLPARSHNDLIRKPYVKSGDFHAFALLPADLGLWSLSVREELITGGRIGKDVGKIWEEFYSKSFTGKDWEVLGEGVRLKENGAVITDVDLLLLRDDLLLVVQIKALTGSGTTQYDHWKNRKIIEWGCEQATTAIEHLRRNPHVLVSIAGKKVAARIKHIEPIVLTNSTLFDGWTYNNVIVAGETLRKSIIDGSAIDYVDRSNNETVRTHTVLDRRDLTTEKILWLLRNPIELYVAADEQVRVVSVALQNTVFHIPDLQLSENAMKLREQDELAIYKSASTET